MFDSRTEFLETHRSAETHFGIGRVIDLHRNVTHHIIITLSKYTKCINTRTVKEFAQENGCTIDYIRFREQLGNESFVMLYFKKSYVLKKDKNDEFHTRIGEITN